MTAQATTKPTATLDTALSADMAIPMLFLSEQDTIDAGVTDMGTCVSVMADTLALFSAGDYRMGGPTGEAQGITMKFPATSPFPTMPLDAPDRRFAAMPAYLGGDYGMAGVKWYGSNVANKQRGWPRSIHIVLLNDPVSGAPVAAMAGNLVSAYRTAAVPGVGAKYLAPDDASVLALIGPGAMNTTSTEAFVAARPGLREVRVNGRTTASSERFIAAQAPRFPMIERWIVAETIEDAVTGADIVSVAATAPSGSANYPYIAESWLKPGAFVSLPANVRFDEDFLIHRARKVTDSHKTFEAWADGLPSPSHESMGMIGMAFVDLIRAGKMTADSVVNIGDILGGTVPARESDNQVVLFSFGGLPIEDVAWGTHVYRTAIEKGIGTPLRFWEAPFLQ